MKSPWKKGVDSVWRPSAIEAKFEKFLQALPQAGNRFSDATRPSTEMVLWVDVVPPRTTYGSSGGSRSVHKAGQSRFQALVERGKMRMTWIQNNE